VSAWEGSEWQRRQEGARERLERLSKRDGDKLNAAEFDQKQAYRVMKACRDLFVGKERKAVQVLPPASEYVNIHPHCLHLYAAIEHDPLPDFRMRQPDGKEGI
jgi:hypothetical protein